eukprot:RCo040039
MDPVLFSLVGQFESHGNFIANTFCLQGEEDNTAVFTEMVEFEQILHCLGLLSKTAVEGLVSRLLQWRQSGVEALQSTRLPSSSISLKKPELSMADKKEIAIDIIFCRGVLTLLGPSKDSFSLSSSFSGSPGATSAVSYLSAALCEALESVAFSRLD